MAAVLRRAAFSLVPVAARCHGFSSLIPRSTGSSYSSVFQFRKGLFASCFLPFSTSSANSHLLTEAIKRKLNATPKESHNAHVEVVKTGDLTLYWESNDESLKIQVKEKTHDDYSETSLQMHIEFDYGDDSSQQVEFDVALPDHHGQVAIQNAETRYLNVDDHFREYIQLHMDEFAGLIQKGGFNCKVDLVVKFARKLKELKECVEPKAESVDAEFSSDWSLTLIWETEDEITEINLRETEYEGLQVRITCRWGEKFYKSMEFRGVVLDDQGQIAIQHARVSIDGFSRPVHEAHLDEFTGMLEKRGLNDGNLDFLVKYALEEASCDLNGEDMNLQLLI